MTREALGAYRKGVPNMPENLALTVANMGFDILERVYVRLLVDFTDDATNQARLTICVLQGTIYEGAYGKALR